MLNAKLNVRRFHPVAALAASLMMALSLGTAPAAAEAPSEVDAHGSAAAPGLVLVRIANQLPDDADVLQLGGHLRPAEEVERGEMGEFWVAPGRAKLVVQASDRKLRSLMTLVPGEEYCTILYSRQAPTFTIIRGKLLPWRSNVRTFEAPKIRCMQIARRNGR